MLTLLIATRNQHKVKEIRDILGDGFRYLTLSDLPEAPEVVEDAHTFAGNATKKAVGLAKWLGEVESSKSQVPSPKSKVHNLWSTVEGREGWYVLADDSGLEVDALKGAPGVHSARFAGLDKGQAGNSSAAENNAKLMRLLEGVPLEKRAARFRCVIALTPVTARTAKESSSPVCYADGSEFQTELFDGTCEGRIGFELRGKGGFGYDPLFLPAGYEQTFGELGEDVKNRLSHRARALEALRSWLGKKT